MGNNNIIANEGEVGDEVLAGLDAADLASHASRLLEDHDDITSVFSQIPVDAFNDLFTGKLKVNNIVILIVFILTLMKWSTCDL